MTTHAGATDDRRAATWRRVLLQPLLALVLVLVGLVVAAGAASAHSTLDRSDPPNGGMVATGRTSLTLWFGESINGSSSSFSVRGSDLSAPPVPTTATLDAGRSVVHLTTAPLERGTYTITWAVVADDGHPTRGTVVFGAGFRPDGIPGSEAGAPDGGQVGLRLLDLGGVLVALGALAVCGRVLGALGALGVRLRRRVLSLGAVGAAVGLVAAVGTPVLTARTQVGGSAATAGEWAAAVRDVLLGSTWGLLWLGRVALLGVALVALVLAVRALPRGPVGAVPGAVADPAALTSGWRHHLGTGSRAGDVALSALVLAAGLDGLAGHASTLPARSAVTAVAATLHVLAAGVWAGALVVLVVTVVPLMRQDRATRRVVTPAAWRAFSPMAAVSTVVLVATGLYEAGRHVESVGGVSRSLYGTAVVTKLVLVALALGLAAYNTVLVNRGVADRLGRALGHGPGWRPRRRRLARTVTVEALVLAVAVAVAALMTSVPTDREVAAARAVTAPHSETIDGLFVTFEAVPVGSQLRLVVRTEAVVRPLPTPAAGVEVGIADGTSSTLTTADGTRTTLTQTEPGRWEASTAAPTASDWTAEVVVHRPGRPDSAVLVPWSSTPADAMTPLELAAGGIAASLLVGLVLVVGLRCRRTSHVEGAPAAPTRPVLEEAGTR